MRERVSYPDADTILVEFGQPMEVLSTLPVVTPGGLARGPVEAVVFRRVGDRDLDSLVEYYTREVRRLGMERALVVTTAAPLEDKFRYVRVGGTSSLLMTIALEPPVCLDSGPYPPITFGTINVVVVTYLPLSYNAMADLLKTVVEAKALASADSLLRCRSRSPGTVSDTVSVLRPQDAGETIAFAGMSTEIGNSVARAVYGQILREALNRGAGELLRDLVGADAESMLRLFSELYLRYPIPGLSPSEAAARASEALRKALRDPNVWSLIVAARELELHGLAGTIPGVTAEEFAGDSKKLVADEIIGMSLALYLAGTNGLFTMYWVERLKEAGVVRHADLGVFSDDVVSALLAHMVVDLLSRSMDDGK